MLMIRADFSRSSGRTTGSDDVEEARAEWPEIEHASGSGEVTGSRDIGGAGWTRAVR